MTNSKPIKTSDNVSKTGLNRQDFKNEVKNLGKKNLLFSTIGTAAGIALMAFSKIGAKNEWLNENAAKTIGLIGLGTTCASSIPLIAENIDGNIENLASSIFDSAFSLL